MSEATSDELADIVEVREEQELRANAFLLSGWKLLKVLAKRDEGEYASYVLGRPSSAPSPLPPPPRPAKQPWE